MCTEGDHNMPLSHEACLEVKVIKKEQTQRALRSPPLYLRVGHKFASVRVFPSLLHQERKPLSSLITGNPT